MSREPCINCGCESDDFMVLEKLMPPEKSICGKCKVEIGQQICKEFSITPTELLKVIKRMAGAD